MFIMKDIMKDIMLVIGYIIPSPIIGFITYIMFIIGYIIPSPVICFITYITPTEDTPVPPLSSDPYLTEDMPPPSYAYSQDTPPPSYAYSQRSVGNRQSLVEGGNSHCPSPHEMEAQITRNRTQIARYWKWTIFLFFLGISINFIIVGFFMGPVIWE